MRPGHYCPGNYENMKDVLRQCKASMRPGHYCPGNGYTKEIAIEKTVASMRPGHYCPGNIHHVRQPQEDPARFNEAGALLPRKFAMSSIGIFPVWLLQ